MGREVLMKRNNQSRYSRWVVVGLLLTFINSTTPRWEVQVQKRQIRWRKDLLISVLEDSVLGLATVLVPMVPTAYPMVRMASQAAMPAMDLMELGSGLKVKVAQGQRGLPNLLDLVTDLDMEDMVLVMVDLVAMG